MKNNSLLFIAISLLCFISLSSFRNSKFISKNPSHQTFIKVKHRAENIVTAETTIETKKATLKEEEETIPDFDEVEKENERLVEGNVEQLVLKKDTPVLKIDSSKKEATSTNKLLKLKDFISSKNDTLSKSGALSQSNTKEAMHSFAITSLILGILGFILPGAAFAGFAVSKITLKHTAKDTKDYKIAKIGFVLSSISSGIKILYYLLLLLYVVFVVALLYLSTANFIK